ncbi:MAG: sigma-70 family RNA polymerase sigma factor [Ruminococcaceae bacterium]|nr:sigma-70 family RNA polymerase sigma factor [Oscillospiraceae bacterium]
MTESKDNSFVTKHFGLVHSIAGRFKDRGIEYEELFSAGCVGLLKAANNFDESRGLKFSTYAVPVIMGEIKQLFRDGGMIKVSRSLKELSLKVTRLRDELIKRGEEPTVSLLSDRLGISVEEVSEALSVSMPPVSLSRYDDNEEDGQTDIPIPPPQLKSTELLALRQIISTLSETDRKLIRYRYWGEYTQSKTALLLGMTQVQVSRRERKILDMIKEKLTC